MTATVHRTSLFRALIPFAFRVLLFWYLIAVLIEYIFPGFVSNQLNLDLFLWLVILTALFSFVIDRKK